MSHRTSAESGISEAVQLRTLRSYYNDCIVNNTLGNSCYPPDAPEGCFIDRKRSAYKVGLADRPAGSQLLRVLKPGDHVLFYDVSRAYRSVRHFTHEIEFLIEAGITPHFAIERLDFSTAAGRLMGRMLSTVAEYYSDMQSDRSKEAAAIKKMLGKKKEKPTTPTERWVESDVYLPPSDTKPILPSGRIFSYVRVSHERSKESGLSPECQRRGNERYADRLIKQNPNLVFSGNHYEDLAVSAFKKDLGERPAGKAMLQQLKPGDHVLFYRCDRGFRQPRDAAVLAEELKKKGIAIHLVDANIDSTSAFGDLFLTVLSVFASMESRIKSVKSKETAQWLRSKGRPAGDPPIFCKVERRGGTKKLKHDFGRMVRSIIVDLLVELDYSRSDICGIVNAIHCEQLRIKSVQLRNRNQFLHTRKLYIEVDRAKMLKETLPKEALEEVTSEARRLLRTPLTYQPAINMLRKGEFPVKVEQVA